LSKQGFITILACVASVSVGFEGIFGILPARKMGREAKMNYGLPNPTETLATQAITISKTWRDSPSPTHPEWDTSQQEVI